MKADHRYLVVTRERFIVFDSGGEGVGAEAVVKSNNHLTELIKMTFKKKDPDLACLYFVNLTPPIAAVKEEEVKEGKDESGPSADSASPSGPGEVPLKMKQFRIAKRKDFIDVLQKNMMRFK